MNQNSLWDDFRLYILQSGNILNKLLAVNVIVFIVFGLFEVFSNLTQTAGGAYHDIMSWLIFPSNPVTFILHPWTIISYQFLHSGFFHLFSNMLMLMFAGKIFREYLGDKKLLSLYLLGGAAGALFYMAAFQTFPFFSAAKDYSTLVGASASIMAILVAVGTLLPRYTVVLIIIGPVQLIYIVLVLAVINILTVTGGNAGGALAHIGGGLFGYLYIRALQSGNDLGAWLSKLIEGISGLFTSSRSARSLKGRSGGAESYIYSSQSNSISDARSPRSSAQNGISQSEIDRILDKISQSGYESLSSKDKDLLFKASHDGQ